MPTHRAYGEAMTYQRLAYDDAASSTEMADDCRAVEAALHLPKRRTTGERMTRATVKAPPSILFEDYPQDVKKPEIAVTEAAARLGAAVHLHLD
jgi:hypothetical protein